MLGGEDVGWCERKGVGRGKLGGDWEKENAISKCHTADMDFGGSFDKRHRLKTVVR